jgi:hypothetical protein
MSGISKERNPFVQLEFLHTPLSYPPTSRNTIAQENYQPPGMPVRTIQTDDGSSFDLNCYGTSDNVATKCSTHEVNANDEAL